MQETDKKNSDQGEQLSAAAQSASSFSNPPVPIQTSIEELMRKNAEQRAAVKTQTPSQQISSVTHQQTHSPIKTQLPAQKPGVSTSAPHQSMQLSQTVVQRKASPPPSIKSYTERSIVIKVIGVGGAGCNAIERMIEDGMTGVEFIAVNTDAQALSRNSASTKIIIGDKITKGRGAGSDPEVGKKAIEQNLEELKTKIKGSDIVFIAAGMGGGTGTGAAPLIADIAKKADALTIAVVTKPFPFEGTHRQKIAREGIMELASKVDTLITVPNDKLFSIANKDLTLIAAFRKVDDILRSGVKGITDIILKTGIINVDFADIQSILLNGGPSQVGIGSSSAADNKAVLAAQNATFSPLFETSIDGAKAILFNITGDSNMSLYEVKAAADTIVNAANPEARIVFGSVIDDTIPNGEIRITVIATGLTGEGGRESEISDFYNQEPSPSISQPNVSYIGSDDDIAMPAILRRNRKLMS